MRIIDWFKHWTFVNDDEKVVKTNKFDAVVEENTDLKLDIENYIISLNEAEVKIQDLTNNQKQDEFSLPSPSTIYYKAPKKQRLQDYVAYRKNDWITNTAHLLINDYNLSSSNEDNIPLACMKWEDKSFRENELVYAKETGDNWDTIEVITEKIINKNWKEMDCNDYMILMYYLIREICKILNVDYKDKLYCAVGGVNNRGYYPDPNQLHAYLVWKSFKDNLPYVVETTYHRGTAISRYLKIPHFNNIMYGYTRYIWTEKCAYRVHAFRNLK